jgi:hypothetical protein
MGCPSICILGENLTFDTQAMDGTGAGVTPTGDVNYAVYENTTTTEILTGTMTVDFDSKTGFCKKQIACTTANGFERYKSYTIRITATVSGVAVVRLLTFICLGTEDLPSASSGALTSTANFKSYAGVTGTDDDTLIGHLINRATSAIEKYCDRTLRSTSYREQYDGNGDYELLLNEYPITAVEFLATGRRDMLRVTNTSSDAFNARVTVDVTNMTLYIDGGTNDGNDELTLASYTLTTLVTAINALGKSWSATLQSSDYGVWNADEILPVMGLECLDSYAYVQIPDEPQSDYQIYANQGVIYCPSGFPSGHNNITIRYTAGHSTTPADLEQICIDLVNTYYRSRETDSTVKSEKLGDHTITYSNEGGGGARDIPQHIAKRLAPYMKQRYAV